MVRAAVGVGNSTSVDQHDQMDTFIPAVDCGHGPR